MSTLVLSEPVLNLTNSAKIPIELFAHGSIFVNDFIDILHVNNGLVMPLGESMPMLFEIDAQPAYLSDNPSTWYINGAKLDFNTSITIGTGTGPVDPTKGIQYWG